MIEQEDTSSAIHPMADELVKTMRLFWIVNALPGTMIYFCAITLERDSLVVLLLSCYGISALYVFCGWWNWLGSGKARPRFAGLHAACATMWLIPTSLVGFVTFRKSRLAFVPDGLSEPNPIGWSEILVCFAVLVWFLVPLALAIWLWWGESISWGENL